MDKLFIMSDPVVYMHLFMFHNKLVVKRTFFIGLSRSMRHVLDVVPSSFDVSTCDKICLKICEQFDLGQLSHSPSIIW